MTKRTLCQQHIPSSESPRCPLCGFPFSEPFLPIKPKASP